MENPEGVLITDEQQKAIERLVIFLDKLQGHESVWHGSVDMLFCPAMVVTSTDLDSAEVQNSAFEMKSGTLEQGRNKMNAECIVFSFAENGLGYRYGPVPMIAISKERMKIFMYDPLSDSLLESSEPDLFAYQNNVLKLQIDALIALWLSINYFHFCTGVNPAHTRLGYTADFKKAMQEISKLEMYEHEVKFGSCKQGPLSKSTLYCKRSLCIGIEHLEKE